MSEYPHTRFLSGDQISVTYGDLYEKQASQTSTWYEKARTLRRYPTAAMARAILSAPIISRQAIISGESTRARRVLEKALLPIYKQYLRNAVFACIDYGWLAFEIGRYRQKINGVYMVKMKPLRHEYTTLMADRDGFLAGAKNVAIGSVREPSLDPDGETIKGKRFAHVAVCDEYSDPYGAAVLRNIETVYDSYLEVEDSAQRYNKRIAGSHWKLTYPVGRTPIGVKDTGETIYKNNNEIAQELIDSLRSSSAVAIPVSPGNVKDMLEGNVTASSTPAWTLELISEQGSQDIFLDRQKFLDALMMRGMLLPERIALEGHFGTKAEASEHADIAMSAIEQYGDNILEWTNGPTGICAAVLANNGITWYPGIAYIEAAPLSDDAKTFMREIMRSLVNGTTDLFRVIDLPELGRKTNVPMNLPQVAQMIKEAQVKAMQDGSGDSSRRRGSDDSELRRDESVGDSAGSDVQTGE